MNFLAGDILLVNSKSGVANAISTFESVEDHDKATYIHAGSFTGRLAKEYYPQTLEQLTLLSYSSLKSYIGCQIKVVRYKGMTAEKYWKAVNSLRPQPGSWLSLYPLWRLGLYALNTVWPSAAGTISSGYFKVCSEVDAWILNQCGCAAIHKWAGVSPDMLDQISIHDPEEFEVIFEGVYTG